ncbi:MAG: flagellar M-ring protein FliF [Firmicutes bacterium]|nr:flagellar M-ring protein FliF [Candidatus Fermentithermobacillaceae bacterium]
MPESLSSVGRGIGDAWNNLKKPQRTVVILSGAVVLILLMILVITSAKGPDYETLWSNLDPTDAGQIVNELEKQGIPYKLTDGGRTIKVPAEQVYKTRLSLATIGLPSSGIVGFESMGSSGIWSTDFERQVQYVRALSGELTRTIKAITGIEDARVHIVLPDPSVFINENKTATAAVLVKTMPGYELSSSSVRGIVNLVSSSVEGLTPSNVTVVDASGKLLSQQSGYDYASNGELPPNSVLELTSNTERELEQRLLSLLTPVLGPGNVVCQVRAELNMDQVKITDTEYTSEPPGILRSSQETTEIYQGTGSVVGGAAGGLDVPSYVTPGEGETQYQHTDIVENFEVNQRTTETIVTPGAIKRLSVAVVVNKNLEEDLKDSIVETVSAALGLDSSRQDQISVTGVFFDTTLADAIGNVLAPEEAFPRTYIYAAVAGVVVVLGIAIFLMVRRRKRKDEEVELPIPDIFVEDIPAIPPEALARQRSRENVERLAKTNPEVVATLIKSWLLEDER